MRKKLVHMLPYGITIEEYPNGVMINGLKIAYNPLRQIDSHVEVVPDDISAIILHLTSRMSLKAKADIIHKSLKEGDMRTALMLHDSIETEGQPPKDIADYGIIIEEIATRSMRGEYLHLPRNKRYVPVLFMSDSHDTKLEGRLYELLDWNGNHYRAGKQFTELAGRASGLPKEKFYMTLSSICTGIAANSSSEHAINEFIDKARNALDTLGFLPAERAIYMHLLDTAMRYTSHRRE